VSWHRDSFHALYFLDFGPPPQADEVCNIILVWSRETAEGLVFWRVLLESLVYGLRWRQLQAHMVSQKHLLSFYTRSCYEDASHHANMGHALNDELIHQLPAAG
jgi:hypothetical protein